MQSVESMATNERQEVREWLLAQDALRLVELNWDDQSVRLRKLRSCRTMLEKSRISRLRQLAGLIRDDISERELLNVLVPVERVASRQRMDDATMGVRSSDQEQEAATFPLTVVVDNLRSAFNIGGIFRTADAMGASALWLCGYSATPEHPQVTRAALGAEKSVNWQHWHSLRDALARLKDEGQTIYALETADRAATVEEHEFVFPCALILGNERFGLDYDILQSADYLLQIPMYGRKNSLNVVSALAVAGYAARRCWHRKESMA